MDLQELRKRIAEQPKKAVINLAKLHESKLRFHSQTTLTTEAIDAPMLDFTAFMQNLLPKDKQEYFKTLLRYPLLTTEVTGEIFDRLFKVFDGQNPVYNYQFRNTENSADWEEYRTGVLNEPQVWQEQGWDKFKTKINSVLIVDMPTGEETPQPYFYFLDIANVLDYEVNPVTGNMQHIIFKQEGKRIAVIDNVAYYLYEEDKSGNIGGLISESPHNLGYCPARFFWDEPLNDNTPDVKKSPLTKVLSKLDWYLFYAISKEHLDLYASYPIYSGYEQDCNYSNERGDTCVGGFLKDVHGNLLYDSATMLPQKCPVCGDSRIVGVGSFIEVPIPQEGQPDLSNPVQMLTADVASLEYNVKECNRLKEQIITSVCGVDKGAMNEQALNETQVKAHYESRNTILNRIAKGFAKARKFVDDTICKLRYGNDFVSSSISLGTDFYKLSTSELRDKYKLAKESGASMSELDVLADQILESEYQNNPQILARMKILADIEPFRHKNTYEILQLYEKGLILPQEFALKMKFDELIRKFERENANVVLFGSQMDYSKKIDKITETLFTYVS